jgi:Spy/CpxP family protein refolding chaperone
MSNFQIKRKKGRTKMKRRVFSLVLILALTGVFLGTAVPQPKQKQKNEYFKGQMLAKLNLTDEQKSKIADLRMDHQKAMIDLKADLEKKVLALKELRLKENIDRNSVLAAVKDINEAKNNIAIARANNMMDMYEVLTPEQQKTWRNNKDLFHEFGGRGKFMRGKDFMQRHNGMQIE